LGRAEAVRFMYPHQGNVRSGRRPSQRGCPKYCEVMLLLCSMEERLPPQKLIPVESRKRSLGANGCRPMPMPGGWRTSVLCP
jgi:hypothetical protein